jgi:hypothetical protein
LEFDVFISHAYEDKETFVRPLADALIARNLRPWYDEFTLRPGDSLRRSIDHGLLTSQAGVVVLSPAFFGKRWTNYELDGLVQLAGGEPNQVAGVGSGGRLIPVWHDVGAGEVTHYSPPLANLVALQSRDGVERVAERIRAALRPAGSTLLFAHAELTELGEPLNWHPPVVTDDWWLDGIEASAKIHDARLLGRRWGFPLPKHRTEARARGHRLAKATAQLMWQRAAEERQISSLTPPGDVLDFIGSFPGLRETALQHPSHLLSYAPQLALPGVAGWLQETIDETFEWACARLRKAGFDPASREGRKRLVRDYGYLSLRDVELIRASPHSAASTWVEGDHSGPRVYEIIDHAGWLVSGSSGWLGDARCDALLQGIAEWRAWTGWTADADLLSPYTPLSEMLENKKNPALKGAIRPILANRLDKTARILGLDESGQVLVDRLLAARFVEAYQRRRPGDGFPGWVRRVILVTQRPDWEGRRQSLLRAKLRAWTMRW